MLLRRLPACARALAPAGLPRCIRIRHAASTAGAGEPGSGDGGTNAVTASPLSTPPVMPPPVVVPPPSTGLVVVGGNTTTAGGERRWMEPVDMAPREVVTALSAHIIGQEAAKKAIAVALRNRWRRLRLGQTQQDEVIPKNILMVRSRCLHHDCRHQYAFYRSSLIISPLDLRISSPAGWANWLRQD